MIPTPAQIRAQVSAVLGKVPDARVIGIKGPLTVELGDTLRVGDMELAVARSDSVLEIRERLEDLAEGSAPMVVITPVDEAELGADVVGRLARRQLFTIDPWQLVKDRFGARFVDPRLVQQHPWVARALLEAEPDGGYPPAPSGFIQADLVWEVLFKALLGLPNSDRDAEAWIEWSLDPDKRQLASRLSAEIRNSLTEAVQRTAGAAARAVFDCATGVLSGGRGGCLPARGWLCGLGARPDLGRRHRRAPWDGIRHRLAGRHLGPGGTKPALRRAARQLDQDRLPRPVGDSGRASH